jgi:uncharacterized protein
MSGRIGLISDTHGLLRPQAVEALKGCELILHAGDVGSFDILNELRNVAPVIAVEGNVDHGNRNLRLPPTASVTIGGRIVYVLHILDELERMPAPAGVSVVVYGHSHKPSIEARNGVQYVNPGSAGPRRFRLPVTVGELTIVNGELVPRIIELDV